ncbi:hypothetical protein PIB30_072610, partial [Stylosanthes scabra]|nr:hypothetical protein [Stylosanthes scabra]
QLNGDNDGNSGGFRPHIFLLHRSAPFSSSLSRISLFPSANIASAVASRIPSNDTPISTAAPASSVTEARVVWKEWRKHAKVEISQRSKNEKQRNGTVVIGLDGSMVAWAALNFEGQKGNFKPSRGL